MKAVLEDLTLTPEKLAGQGFWRYGSWIDTPVILVGAERLGPSDALIALGGMAGDDHMLRLAALVDRPQYVRVSGAREERMIALYRRILEPVEWTVTPRFGLSDPLGDVDVYAVRGRDRMVIQLKSTLRPESPWEVYKRNADILDGIEQAHRARAQLGEDVTGVVITDGYRGDFASWRVGPSDAWRARHQVSPRRTPAARTEARETRRTHGTTQRQGRAHHGGEQGHRARDEPHVRAGGR